MADEEYKKKQIETLQMFTKNSVDPSGNTITNILSKSDEYVIYEVSSDVLSESIKVYVHSIEQDDPNNLEENFTKIKLELNEVKAVLYKSRRENSFKHTAVRLNIDQAQLV